ncbi:MAG: double-strand break repair helicase AddA [Alphaproteobacteria bacterium]
MKLSPAQKQALDPYTSCWVEASAGSGKTKVLTDRVLSLLLVGVEVEDILCLTFTKAAGAEMSNRVRERLQEWACMDQSLLRIELHDFLAGVVTPDILKKAQTLFLDVLNKTGGIKIQTIHGFCQSLLRIFPLEAGLLPHFKVMNDIEKKQILDQCYKQFCYELSEQEIKFLSSHLSENQLFQFCDFFLDHKEQLSTISNEQFLENLSKTLGVKSVFTDSNPSFSFFTMDPSILSCQKITSADCKLCESLVAFEGYTDLEKLERLQEYKSFFLTAEGTIRKRIISKAFQNHFPQVASGLEEHALYVFDHEEQVIKNKTFERSAILIGIAKKFIKIYEQLKMHRALLDYDDLIICARNLLKKSHIKPWILEKLDYKLKHILIDEAQDTSQIQWDLILTLIEEFYADTASHSSRTLFVVGDLKQSIYSFQGASPTAFQKAKTAFQKLPSCKTISLSTSYRSTPAVLQFVDQVFQSPLLGADAVSCHHGARQDAAGIVELWPLLEGEEKESVEDTWASMDSVYTKKESRYILAEKIGTQLEDWFERGAFLTSKNRLLEPRDIMILVRRRDSFIQELIRTLKVKKIPVTGLDRMVLNDQLVVKDLLCLCDVLLLPENDLSLAILLKSPFFGISEEDLFLVCSQRGDSTLWEYLQSQSTYSDLVGRLKHWQENSRTQSPYKFFKWVLEVEGGRVKLLSRLGAEVQDVLDEFLMTCEEYEAHYGVSLQCFVEWVRQQNIEIKRSLEQTEENKVRVLTVHGAKGLQAPIVFLPDTTQIPVSKAPLYWSDDQPCLLWMDKDVRKTPVFSAFSNKEKELQEYYRLLYVALTRAEDSLYISGWQTKKETSYPSWYQLVESSLKKIGSAVSIREGEMGWQYGHPNLTFVKDRHSEPEGKNLFSSPSWLKEKWKGSLQNKITPSKNDSTTLSVYQKNKGVLIHKILEWIIYAIPHRRSFLVDRYLSNLSLTEDQNQAIKKSIDNVLSHPDFKVFFNQSTRTEVPIQGRIGDNCVRGTLDALTVWDDQKKVYILDYKTGEFLTSYKESPPLDYVRQMNLYARMVQDIYPTYEVTPVLLWTDIGWFQKV